MNNTVYIAYNFTITPLQPASDILIAELGAAGFESFVEEERGIVAYIQQADWYETILEGIQILIHPNFEITFTQEEIAQENWNAAWEENFKPIQVGDLCVVRAPFHEAPKVVYDIVIAPKMSFGTGHHETTFMMLEHILEHDFKNKKVLDMGSGTGVLSILAAMRGAFAVDAIDVDNWCYLNALENVERNACSQVKVCEGDVGLLKEQQYDIILANINRNILLSDIPAYVGCLKEGGALFLSGFYEEDIPLISKKCVNEGLKFKKNSKKNNWVAVKYVF